MCIWQNLAWSPVGVDLCPTVCSFIEVVEEDVDESTVEASLEVGKAPHMKESVEWMVEKFQKTRSSEVEQVFFDNMVIGEFAYFCCHKMDFILLKNLCGL